MGSFGRGEVKIFSRIKLPPPLPRSRDFLPSGGRYEKSSVANGVDGKKKFPSMEGNFCFVG